MYSIAVVLSIGIVSVGVVLFWEIEEFNGCVSIVVVLSLCWVESGILIVLNSVVCSKVWDVFCPYIDECDVVNCVVLKDDVCVAKVVVVSVVYDWVEVCK